MIRVTIARLQEYMTSRQPNQSLREYLGDDDVSFVDIIFNEIIDLRGADLSGCNLDGVVFNKYVKLEGADLRCATLNATKFIEQITLTGVNFGYLDLNSKIFENCQMKGAIYAPSNKKIKEIAVTEQQLAHFKSHNNGQPLSVYLQQKYPGNAVIPDLSNAIIDESFNGLDLSGCKFIGTTFKGNINNLILRDCYFEQIKPEADCKLINTDLRGTSLTCGREYGPDGGFRSIDKGLMLELENPRLSIGSTAGLGQYELKGVARLDPCYARGSNRQDSIPLTTATISDGNQPITENIDFSHWDLVTADFKGKIFTNCNFAHCKLSGCDFTGATFNNCNFQLADFSKKILGYWYSGASIAQAKVNNCDFTGANWTGLNAQKADFIKLRAINIHAGGDGGFFGWLLGGQLNMQGTNAPDGEFQGANCPGIRAKNLNAEGANFKQYNGNDGDFTDSNLAYSNIIEASHQRANFTRTNLKKARFSTDKNDCILKETIISDADLDGLFGGPPAIVEALVGEAIFSESAVDLKNIKLAQDKNRVKQRYYNNFMKVVIVATVAIVIIAPYASPALAIVANWAAAAAVATAVIDHYIPRVELKKKLATILGVDQWIEKRVELDSANIDQQIAVNNGKIHAINQAKEAIKAMNIDNTRQQTNFREKIEPSKKQNLDKPILTYQESVILQQQLKEGVDHDRANN